MALLDADDDGVLIEAAPSPRLPAVMGRLRARRDGRRWRTAAHRALDVLDALRHAQVVRSDAFDDLAYRLRYGGDPDEVQSCLALKRGLEVPPPGPRLRKPLYPYQEEAVAFLDRAGSGILADEPGLGKTLQGIAFALLSPRPCLVVCPATAKHVWEREIAQSVPGHPTVQTIAGTSPTTLEDADFTIINHDILASHADALEAHGFGCLIADEVHRCKNIRAQRTQALVRVADAVPRKLLLSGTLMMNSAEDLYPPLRIVRPSSYPDFQAFCQRYTTTRRVRQRVRGRWRSRTVRTGSRNLFELHDRMEPFTVRRTLADVRDQLPELRHTVVGIDLPEDLAAEYRRRRASPTRTGQEMEAARQALEVCLEAKQRVLPEVLEDRLAAGRKILVFSTRLSLLEAAQEAAPALRIDGSVPAPQRRAIEERFQSDPDIRLFLGQTRACGEALTLDAADTVVLAEADWSPQANEQAVRRALRINTPHAVEVLWLVVRGTLDEARLEVLRRKRGEFSAVMEGDVLEEALASGL